MGVGATATQRRQDTPSGTTVERTPKLVTADGEVVTLAGVHPLAEMAPMLPEAELRELAESIGAVGLLNPVIVDRDGLLIDGRNRLAACDLAGVDARCVIHDGDAAEVVLAAEDRRHLTPGARAAWRAKVMAAAGYRVNGRWKYGKVEFHGSVKLATARNDISRAGVVLDYLPHLLDDNLRKTISREFPWEASR